MGKLAEISPVSESSLAGRRVLVADDEAAPRWERVARLRAAGARVVEARDGLEALDLARAEQPDLIVADTRMPRLDGLALCDALRKDPSAAEIPVVLLSETRPPEVVASVGDRSNGLIDAVLDALLSRPDGSDDPDERENVRAQSAVAMHRDPANHVSHRVDVPWRLPTSRVPRADGSVFGFGAELRVMSRIFGAALVALVIATAGLIAWRIAATPGHSETQPVVRAPGPADTGPVVRAPGPADTQPAVRRPEVADGPSVEVGQAREAAPALPAAPSRGGLTAFSGELVPGVDVEIVAAGRQGALVLEGPPEIHASIDGVDRGPLPVSVVLDEGRHLVRYRIHSRISDRFYFVKAGFTRVLRVVTRPGGFVDAR